MKKIITCFCIGLCRSSVVRNIFDNGARKVAALLLFILTGMTVSLYAVPKETVESLVDENRLLSAPLELHLTSADVPFTNSTVSLNHEDAWLFFDNIKPSVVIDNYVSNVLINGEQLVSGVNGRVAIYAHGTVIMPHASSFKPLIVYGEEDFGGNLQQMAIHTYYNNLGDMDNAIKSFKLKRGYMATFANNADGSGYSRVFIADEEDLEFSVMPDELDGTVSFIRVFKHQWVSKKGKAGWDPHILNGTTYYDWNIGGGSSNDVEYAAIRQNAGWPSWTDINNKQNITHLLGYNEPDRPDQSNMTFQQMIDIWPGMMNSGLRIGSPAYSNAWSGAPGGNLFDFIDKCDELNYRVDFVALHCYWGGKSPQSWYNDLKYIHERTGRPLWITEWNNGANWTTEWWPDDTWELTEANAQKQLNDIKGILQVLDTASFVERYFIYDWVEDRRAMVLNGELTPAGEYYAANKSQIAYNSANEVIPHWNYQVPELSYRYLSLSNTIRLSWTDSNGELSRSYKVEKKVNDGNFETIYNSDDVSVLSYIDPLDPEVGGTITYRISLRTSQGEYIISNEVSYFQTAGSNNVQVGSFRLNNSEWNTSLFSEKYSTAPLVLLGIPTFNNIVPMTQRVNNVSTTSFKFHLNPWDYLNNPNLTKTDVLSAMALPEGTYNFSGLKAEAKAVPNVTREWFAVTFDEAFATEPVVFCTVVSNSTPYPLTVAVRNVTNTGFELRVKTEEAITGTVIPEKINCFAIEPGQGVMAGKRITVGRTTEGSGVSTTPVEVEYDATYTEPAVFAGFLTDADSFTSTLRYYVSGDNKVKILKQREMSGSISKIHEDQIGWMVMDLAADQVINANEDILVNPLMFYPNPVTDVIYFNFDQPTLIEVFDIAGRKQLEAIVLHSLDVSSLPEGVYLLKVEGSLPTKFMKK